MSSSPSRLRARKLDAHEQRLVRFLSRRATYPHPVGPIGHRETHVSHVFLAGEFAYKLKKPVRFPFVDASALASRKRFCRLELTLNRRLAPQVYLGMVPVVEPYKNPRRAESRARARGPRRGMETAQGLRLGGRGRIIEWLVKMRRLPEIQMLDQVIARRQAGRRDMEAIADRLISFFRKAARSRRIDHYGRPAQVAALVLGNLAECQPFLGTLLPEADRQILERCYRQYLALREPLLSRRVREGRIVDGHGDLRCENICLTKPVAVFDCVEFQPAFRCGDVVNDLSFLLMDLEFRGRRDLAKAVESRYLARVADPTAAAVLPLYKCHRSLVRGKVRGFAWLQHPNTRAGRRIKVLSRRHFQLAVRYARQFAKPRLLVVGGLIGTGKSTLARSLAGAFGAVWLRTDEIRLREFARSRRPFDSAQGAILSHVEGRRKGQGFSEGIYAPHISELVYQWLIQRAEAHLREGRTVVCDGTFSKASGRSLLRDIARRTGASFHYFECAVPRAVALRRIAKRAAAGRDLSEARPEHYDRLKAGYEPVRGWRARDWTRLSDNRPPEQTFQAALAVLRRAWLGGHSSKK